VWENGEKLNIKAQQDSQPSDFVAQMFSMSQKA